MIKKTFHFSFKLLFEIVAAVIAGALILLGAFVYHISQEPFKLNFLKPYVQDTISNVYPNLNFSTQQGFLAFEDGDFKVIFDDVKVSSSDFQSFINIDRLNLAFSFQSILQQVPSSIEAVKARVVLHIGEDGNMSFQLEKDAAPVAVRTDEKPVANRLSEALMNKKISALKQLSFVNSNLTIIDEMSGNNWDFKEVDILYKRDKNGSVLGATQLNIQGELVDLETIYHADSLETDMTLNFDKVNVSDFANRFDRLEDLDTVVSGKVHINFDRNLNIGVIDLEGQIFEGSSIAVDQFFGHPLAVSGEFDLLYHDEILKTEMLNLNIEGIETQNDVIIDLSEERKTLSYKLSSDDFLISKIENCWPSGVSDGAKNWILKNIKEGGAEKVQLEMEASATGTEDFSLDKLSGYIDFSNLSVSYLDSMPVVENLVGKASFNENVFDIEINEGNLYDVYIKPNSRVTIPLENTVISIDLNMAGNLKTVAQTINRKPLEYLEFMDFSPEDVTGKMLGNLKLEVPINGENIQVSAKTSMSDVAINNLIFGLDLLIGAGSLNVDNKKLDLDLLGELNRAKLHVKWDEFFADDSEYDRVAEIGGAMDIKLLKELNILNLTESVDGDLPVNALYKSKAGTGSVSVRSDLLGSEIDLFPVPYKKAAEEKASLEMLINLEDNKFKELDSIMIRGDDLELDGWYDGKVLYLSKLAMPDKNILITGHKETKQNGVPNIDISGTIGDNVRLKIVPRNGINTIDFLIEDLGATLKSLGIFKKLEGGNLILNGQSSAENVNLINGRVTMSDFNVVKMDVLTTMLGAMSLDGLSSALSGEGIAFEKLAANFKWDYDNQQFLFNNGKTSGSSLGLTFDNIWDMEHNTIAMKGTVAPLQGISNVIGSIPIIGHVLTGANQDGLFGAKYTIRGPLSNPEVDVKGASSLTPGILRDVFFSSESLEKTIERENQKKVKENELEEEMEKEEEALDKLRGVQ